MRREEEMSGREEKGISTVTNLWNADIRGGEMERNTAKEGGKGGKITRE